MSELSNEEANRVALAEVENSQLREVLAMLLKLHIAHHNHPTHALARLVLGYSPK